jgi:2-amino-4-hydroxy-6-hydroxymethyldihydropteridine diphosphokinase
MEHTVYIGIGSNLGDRMQNTCDAIRSLENHPGIRVVSVSHFYETEPLTLKDQKQNWYLNCVIKVKTSLNAVRLFKIMQEIEIGLGRSRLQKWEPRTIDLDLLFFDGDIIRSKSLVVPHPELHRRRFVLEPLAEIAANLIHPIKGISIRALLKELKDNKRIYPLYKFQISHSSEGVLQTPLHERL